MLKSGFWGRITTFVILLSFLLVAGCAPRTNEIAANVGEEFSIAIGQSASIAGEGLRMKFIEVVTDSRCSTGANCIWQGEIACLVEITHLESVNRKTLTQPGLTKQPSQAEFKDYRISFDVAPYPVVGKEIKESDYRLQLRIDKSG